MTSATTGTKTEVRGDVLNPGFVKVLDADTPLRFRKRTVAEAPLAESDDDEA